MIVIGLMWSKSPYFMTFDNLATAASVVSILGIMAIAETMLILAGEIDISIGSVMAVTSVVIGALVGHGWNVWVCVAIAFVLSAIIGLINGVLTVFLRINSLVVTLGAYSIVLGIAYVLSDSTTVIIDGSGFDWLGSADIWRIPVPVVIFVIVWIIGQYVLRATALGRHIYATGDNADSAVRAGIRADLAARRALHRDVDGRGARRRHRHLAALLAAPQVGDPYLLSVVTAVILGGTSLAGGRGSLWGTLVAIAILGVVQNGFALLQYSVYTQDIVQGGLLILAVLTDQFVRRAER